jgi:hypothetical protein
MAESGGQQKVEWQAAIIRRYAESSPPGHAMSSIIDASGIARRYLVNGAPRDSSRSYHLSNSKD